MARRKMTQAEKDRAAQARTLARMRAAEAAAVGLGASRRRPTAGSLFAGEVREVSEADAYWAWRRKSAMFAGMGVSLYARPLLVVQVNAIEALARDVLGAEVFGLALGYARETYGDYHQYAWGFWRDLLTGRPRIISWRSEPAERHGFTSGGFVAVPDVVIEAASPISDDEYRRAFPPGGWAEVGTDDDPAGLFPVVMAALSQGVNHGV